MDFLEGSDYALYNYLVNRPKESQLTEKADSPVSDSPRQSSSTGDFSLSLAESSLASEQEAELCAFLVKRLSRGVVYTSSSGHIHTVNLAGGKGNDDSNQKKHCYYSLVKQENMLVELESVGSVCYNEFVICLLISEEFNLDVFKQELDSFTRKFSFHVNQSQASEPAMCEYLKDWPRMTISYLIRCIDMFKQDIQFIIHSSLEESGIEIDGVADQVRDDLLMFAESCSLSDVLHPLKIDATMPISDALLLDLDSEDGVSSNPLKISLVNSQLVFSSQKTTPFCCDWAEALNNKTEPFVLRQIIENYKIKAIQDMNHLKRLMRQAETDHYSLYRSYQFLRSCGNGQVLLSHAKLESVPADSTEILEILEEFIRSKGGYDVVCEG